MKLGIKYMSGVIFSPPATSSIRCPQLAEQVHDNPKDAGGGGTAEKVLLLDPTSQISLTDRVHSMPLLLEQVRQANPIEWNSSSLYYLHSRHCYIALLRHSHVQWDLLLHLSSPSQFSVAHVFFRHVPTNFAIFISWAPCLVSKG